MRSSTIKDAAREAARGVSERAAAEQAQMDQLRERLAPVVDHAIQVAREQAAQAAVAAGHAREWAAPRVGAAVERGRLAAAPHVEAAVEAAAERVVPAVDAARDHIVEDLLPRILEAVHQATVAGSAAKAAATETVSRTVEEAARSLADATPTAKARVRRRRRRARTLWMALAAALLSAAAAAAWRRAKARQAAAWEVPPTGVPTGGMSHDTASAPAADGSAMDVIAAAAGPSDAGVAAPSPLRDAEPTELAEQIAKESAEAPEQAVDTVAPLTSAPSTGVDAEPASGSSESSGSSGPSASSGPEAVGIDTGVGDAEAAQHGHRG